jgi:hypothetical protein
MGPGEHHRGQLSGDSSLSVRWRAKALQAGFIFVAASVAAVDTTDVEVLTADSTTKLLTIN